MTGSMYDFKAPITKVNDIPVLEPVGHLEVRHHIVLGVKVFGKLGPEQAIGDEETPAQRQQREYAEQQPAALEHLEADSLVKAAGEKLGAKLIPETVVSRD